MTSITKSRSTSVIPCSSRSNPSTGQFFPSNEFFSCDQIFSRHDNFPPQLMLAIINYGLGNLTSIRNMCRRIGVEAEITADPAVIASAGRLILPGVGHFRKGMENLHSSGLKRLLDRLVLEEKRPILGICLGAQLMTGHSEEGDTDGLGWVDADTVRFRDWDLNGLKVPHMGWREIRITGENGITGENPGTPPMNPLWVGLPEEPRFYFVHSYHF